MEGFKSNEITSISNEIYQSTLTKQVSSKKSKYFVVIIHSQPGESDTWLFLSVFLKIKGSENQTEWKNNTKISPVYLPFWSQPKLQKSVVSWKMKPIFQAQRV